MLRSVFPDEPVGDDNVAAADTPGAFFAEFLPKDIKVPRQTAAERQQQQQQQLEGDEDTLSDQTTHACPPDVQVKLEGQQTAAQAAAAAQASAAEATAAACAAASRAAQQAAAATSDHSAPSDAVQAAGDGVEDKDSDFDLPSIAEIRSALAESWFGNGEAAPAGPSTTNGKAAGGEAQQNEEDDEGLLEKLLPFGKDGPLRRKTGLVPTFKAKKPKPLRLKLAEQVLSKEMLSAVQVVEQEILSSTDPLASAIIKFFLKAGRNMGQGWARNNLPRVCGLFSAYVAATCGVMHGLKAATKWLAWRIPRVGKRAAGPAVSFTSDVLLPTPFFGPFLATYVLVMLVCRERKRDEGEDQEAAETAAGDNPAPDGSSTKPQQQQQQQQVVVERTRSRELQLEFVVDSPLPQHRGQVRRGRRLARATSIKGKVKRAVGSSRPCPEGAAAGAGDTTPVSTS